MSVNDRPQRIADIYHSALKCQGKQRAEYMQRACAGDEDLRREVESLFGYDAHLPGFLETPALEQAVRGGLIEDSSVLGSTIGRYEVTSLLGAGGMGEVYLARDTRLGRLVALKMLPRDLATDPQRKQHLLLEARTISTLTHPHIVTLYDLGCEAGTDFLVMEYVPGKTLDKLIPHGGLETNKALDYAIQIATACEKAHAAGIIHRDLKPGNVIVSEDGGAKVLDFGLAKLIATEELSGTAEVRGLKSNRGTIVGTAPYMSPEQARGEPGDARSDVFSFGVVLYELLTGLRPFDGEGRTEIMAAVVASEPEPLTAINTGISPQLESVVLRCLQKDPARRFQTMADLRAALEESKGTESGKPAATAGSARRRRRRVALAVASGVLLAAVVFFWRRDQVSTLPARTLTRITWTGAAAEPTISRDGTLLAYSAPSGARSDIWVQRIGEDGALQVTHDPTGAYCPAFSPDGTHIAFHSLRRGVFETSVRGGEPRFLASGAGVRYLPDGSRILFQDDRGHLSIVPVNGGMSITVHPSLVVDNLGLVLSPDGTKVLVRGYMDAGPLEYRWWRVSLADGKLEEVTPPAGPTQREVPWPEAWVMVNRDPRRQWLIFGRWSATSSEPYNAGENRNLFRVTVSSAGKINSIPEQLTFTPGTAIYTRASENGRMVFRFDNQSASLRSIPIDTDTGRVIGHVEELKHLQGVFNPAPALSRDGRIVTFWSGKRICILDRRTGRENVLTPELHPSDSAGPKVSPDGSSVLYYQRDVDHLTKRDLYAISIAGGPPRHVCYDCGIPGGFTSNGEDLLTRVARNSRGRIALVHLATGETKEVLSHPSHSLGGPSFSWDDRWITFVERLDDLHSRIVVTRVKNLTPPVDSHWTSITSGAYSDEKPQFSPSGTLLYFVSDRDGSKCIWAQRLEPGTKRPIGDPFAIQHFHQSLSLFRSTPEVNVTLTEIVTHADLIVGDVWMIDLNHGM